MDGYLKEQYIFTVAIFIVTKHNGNHIRRLVNQIVELHTIGYYTSLKII